MNKINKTFYFDCNATTPVAPEVIAAMRPYFTEHWANPSSLHSMGSRARRAVDQARDSVASFLGASDSGEIVFTSSGTESNNLALRGSAKARRRVHLLTSDIEHAAVLEPMAVLAEEEGYGLEKIPVDNQGIIDMERLRASLFEEKETVLASFMWANNETGVVSPIAQLAEEIKHAGGLIHTDAVQAAGKIPIDVQQVPVDLLSISGHKLYAPKGIGALYIRRGSRLEAQIKGGSQERGRRGGTENVAYIAGLGTACELAVQHLKKDAEREAELRKRLEKGIQSFCPEAEIVGSQSERLPNTANICFRYMEGEAVLLMLDDQGICVSAGAACESGSIEPSHVLKAMNLERALINGAVRWSIGRYTTPADIDYVLEKLPPLLNRLKELSPYFQTGA